jgi:hypothetical protein
MILTFEISAKSNKTAFPGIKNIVFPGAKEPKELKGICLLCEKNPIEQYQSYLETPSKW